MPWSTEYCHPTPATEEEGYRNLSFAVVASLIADLQGTHPLRRRKARASVLAGVHLFWLDLLDVSDPARARVEDLLWELAR
jgi:hypothetical protein